MRVEFTVQARPSMRLARRDLGAIAFEQHRILIGRGTEADLRLPHASVGRQHLVVEWRDQQLTATDLDSTSGTYLEGRRLVPGHRRKLQDGQTLVCGAFALTVHQGAHRSPPTDLAGAQQLCRHMLCLLESALQPTPFLQTVHAPEGKQPQSLPLRAREAPYTVGRAEDCDLCLDDPDVSRVHLYVERHAYESFLRDNDSKNGTRLGGATLTKLRRLKDGEAIQLGSSLLRFHDEVEARLAALATGPDAELQTQAGETTPAQGLPAPSANEAPAHRPARGFSQVEWVVLAVALVVLGVSSVSLGYLLGMW